MTNQKEVPNVLIKVSGDLAENNEFFDFVVKKAKTNYVVVISGGGTKINQALEDAGYTIQFNDHHGRITKTWQERIIARDVLERAQKELQDKFVGKGVAVIAPILSPASVLCHINGDNLVKAFYLGFEEIYVFTLESRLENKKAFFTDSPKVEIISI
jgi:acetylglutamate kinase